MSPPSFPTLDAARTPAVSRLDGWARWFMQPDVLLRVVLYAAVLVYMRTVLFDYVYDDIYLLTLNPWMQSWKYVPTFFTHSFWGFLEIPRVVDFYRPFVMLVLAAIYHTLGAAPGWFHLISAALHIAATCLVYRFVAEMGGGDKTLAAVAAGIFGLHPTKVETAAWISGISDSLSLVFFLISLIAYLSWRRGGASQWRGMFTAAVFLLLALFSKEAAIFVPVLIAVYEFSVAREGFRDPWIAVRGVWPLGAIVLLAIAARTWLVRDLSAGMVNKLSVVPAVLVAPQATWWYLGKQLWPVGLSIHYPIMVGRFSLATFILPFLVLALVGSGILIRVRHSPTGVFFVTWLFLMLAPVILYQPTLQQHDRYFYFASVATSTALAWLIVQLRRLSVVWQAATVLTIFVALGTLTFNYEYYWDNDVRLFTRAMKIAPRNPNVAEYLASTYANRHQFEKAESVAEALVATPEQRAEGWYILGNVRLSEGNQEAARQAMQNAVQMTKGHNLLANVGLATADLQLGRNEEAAEIYREQIKKYPNLACLHRDLAQTLKAMGKSQEAAKEVELQRHLERD